MDAVFGAPRFRNEVVWQRTTAKGLASARFPSNHDVILCYGKTSDIHWNSEATFIPYDPSRLDEKTASKYRHKDPDGRIYRLDNLINPNKDRPNLTYEFLGVTRVWRWTRERMQGRFRCRDCGASTGRKGASVETVSRQATGATDWGYLGRCCADQFTRPRARRLSHTEAARAAGAHRRGQ